MTPHLEVAKMPFWLSSLHSSWVRRNEATPGKGLAFDEYVVNRDDLEKFVRNCDLEMVKMRLGQGTLCNEFNAKIGVLHAEISALRQEVEDLRSTENLKEPRSQKAFDAIRQSLFSFNKRNMKDKDAKKTWGKDNEFDLIKDRKSLEAWLTSKHAKKYELDMSVIDHFNVCVVKGELATIGREFEGGVGIEAFWIPQDKYDKVNQRSTCYSSTDAVRRDPRHGYMLNGVKWAPSGGKQKRKHS